MFTTNIKPNLAEYCGREDFIAHCAGGDVIVMTRAVYGRMRLGKCITQDVGYLGCQTDVLGVMDDVCSSRDRCRVQPLLDLNFHSHIQNPCMGELMRYLEADFSCRRGTRIDTHIIFAIVITITKLTTLYINMFMPIIGTCTCTCTHKSKP